VLGTPEPSTAGVPSARLDEAQRLYLDLLRKCLTRFITGGESFRPIMPKTRVARRAWRAVEFTLRRAGVRLLRPMRFDASLREEGRDWPAEAETMVGLKRLENLEAIIVDVFRRDVPGDLVETGVWRGGASIFMRGVLKALGDPYRKVWLCDSFRGLPPPSPEKYAADAGDRHHTYEELAVTQEQVRANFARYGLLDERVEFVAGWFRDTLPSAPISRISVLRLDGDMYESTTTARSPRVDKPSAISAASMR